MNPIGDLPAPRAQLGTPHAGHASTPARSGWRALQGWPTLAGIAFGAFVAYGLSRGSELAPVLAASGLVYLAAAALRKPSAAWPVFFVSVAIITAARFGLTGIDATWLLLALAGVTTAYGLIRGATRPAGGLPLQALAMVAFGGAAALALITKGPAGAYLVAAGLLAHAAWDVHHHRINKVVIRSMAEFCVALDLLLAAAIVIVTARS